MKIHAILMLFPIMSMAMTWTWQSAIWDWRERAGDFLSDPWKRSRIPQFILDSGHDWVVHHQSELEKISDVGSLLCTPYANGTATDHQEGQEDSLAPELEVPPDLFDYIEINNDRRGTSRPGWANAILRAREILNCPAALAQAKTLDVNIWVFKDQSIFAPYPTKPWLQALEPWWRSHEPPREVTDLFVDMLGNMTNISGNLTTLYWRVTFGSQPIFEARFLERGLVLPSVKRLVLPYSRSDSVSGSGSDLSSSIYFLLRFCPNITTLESQADRQDLLQPLLRYISAFVTPPGLKRFAFGPGWYGWEMSMIRDVVSYLPSIESLGLWDGLGRNMYRYYDDDEDDFYSIRTPSKPRPSLLKDALEILTGLPNLTHLELGPASRLDVGWDGGPWCGNAYHGPEGRRYQRQVGLKGIEATERAAAIVIDILPRLESLRIGGSPATIIRHDNGTLEAQFPWTGHVNDWVTEISPNRPGDEPGDEL